MVALKLLIFSSYCEAPEPEQLEAQSSLKALHTPGIQKRTPVLLCNLIYEISLTCWDNQIALIG